MSIQFSKILTNIITKNPYITNNEAKKKFLANLIKYLKDLCDTIKQFQLSNKSKYNYFTGQLDPNNSRPVNDLNYKEIIEEKNRKLDKNDVLKQLREHKNEFKTFSIKKGKKDLIEKEEIKSNEDDIKTKILRVINPYSENNIKYEWERMRKVWYQNNQRFNPIFKLKENNNIIRRNGLLTGSNNDNNKNAPGSNNKEASSNLFTNVQGIKTNQ